MPLLTSITKALKRTPKRDEKAASLTDLEAFGLFAGTSTSTGINVNAAQAMRVPAVACAVSLISETIGALPCKIHNSETKETERAHPAFRLVHDEANEWTSAAHLRTQLTLDALTRDTGGFALVTRYSDGRPAELHRLDPSKVTIGTEADGAPFYIVQNTSGKIRYPHTEIIHIAPFGGICPVNLAREAIGLAIAFEQHIGSLFANGGRPSGIITAQKTLDFDAKRKVAASWLKTHSGRNAGGTAILDEGMDYKALSTTLADAQFAENRVEQVREIARAFRVPPTMLFELSRGTWSNTEEMARQFLAVTLKPWLRTWEFAYARALLTPEERLALRVEFVVDDLLTTDAATRATSYASYRAMGAMTANEVRAGLNLPANTDGDTLTNPYTVSNAMTKTDDA